MPTASVRIDDLREPRLTPDQRAALERAAALDVSFDDGALIDEAMARTGLADVGDESFLPRLRAHLDAIESDVGLTEFGRVTLRNRVVRLLSSRLQLTDLVRRHPEIADIPLDPPVVVVGLPRSGTTHLVNLLAADTRVRSLPFWESQEPFPQPGEGPGADGVDPRYRRCARAYEQGDRILPLGKAMHDRSPEAVEEEVELLDIDFASYCLEWHARVPGWRDAYLGFDHVATYASLKMVLQALTFLRGPRRWVLKSPQHLEQLPALDVTFPGATIAFTHRDPVAVIQSAVTMLAYADRLRRRAVEPESLAAYWVDRIERLLRASVRDRELIPADRTVDVLFHEFIQDDLATAERIQARGGIDATEQSRSQIARYLAANPRGKHGQLVYDLAGDFGLDPGDVRARFDFYFDRFPVQVESTP